jgi:hypothetical protein
MKRHIRLDESRGPGIGGQRPLVTLNVRSRFGNFAPVLFCVDTGADLPAIPISLAQEEGIAIPRANTVGERAAGSLVLPCATEV